MEVDALSSGSRQSAVDLLRRRFKAEEQETPVPTPPIDLPRGLGDVHTSQTPPSDDEGDDPTPSDSDSGSRNSDLLFVCVSCAL